MTRIQICDLQAVVFCGSGHKLIPLVDEEKVPKCMLPVANKPMLYYPLTWLQNSGITDILVVAHTNGGQKIQSYLQRGFEGSKVELVLQDEHQGTAEILWSIKNRIKNDFLVVSCDLITDFPLGSLLQRWQLGEAEFMSVLVPPVPFNFGQKPKESTEPKHRLTDDDGVVIGLNEDSKQILSWIIRCDLDSSAVPIKMSLITRFPKLYLRTDLNDVHLYLFRKSILDREELFEEQYSLREDVVPRIVQRQMGADIYYQCECIIVDGGYCLRSNTISSFAECGKQLARMAASSGIRLISQAAELAAKTQIGNDSIIGDHSVVGEKSSVKRSIVGNHVQIGKNVKISNSVILDHVTIEDNVKLEGCTVGMRAVVQEKCALKDCDIGGEHIVDKETNRRGEIMGGSRDIYLDDGFNHTSQL